MSKLLDEFLEIEPFAADVNRSTRTIRRWIDMPGGLPYTTVGNRILIHIPTARNWLLGRMKNVPRTRKR
jgi:hypothetical protein